MVTRINPLNFNMCFSVEWSPTSLITSKSSYYIFLIQVHSNDQTMLFTTVEKLREGSCVALSIVGRLMRWWLTVLLTFLVIKLLKYTKAWEISEHQLVTRHMLMIFVLQNSVSSMRSLRRMSRDLHVNRCLRVIFCKIRTFPWHGIS